jgi:trimeric autotransporter adhesin
MKTSRTIVLAVAIVVATAFATAAWAGGGTTATTAQRLGVTNTIEASPPTWGTYAPPSFGPIAFAPDGTLYTSDCGNARIYKVDAEGKTTVFAGTGPGGFTKFHFVHKFGWVTVASYGGDGQHATDAFFGCPTGIAFDAGGNLLLGEHNNSRIREIDTDGFVSTVAGVGPGFDWGGPWTAGIGPQSGVGGPAVHAVLAAPTGILFDPKGNLLFVDRDHDAVQKIDSKGKLTTVAGTGFRGYNGDNRQATSARLNRPLFIALDTAGDLYISDENNYRIRKVDSTGVITTVAGNGEYGCGGDDGPAVDASFRNPGDIVFAPDGSLLVSDGECHQIRRIAPNGTISTVAGGRGCSGLFARPLRKVPVASDVYLRYGPDGDLYISDPGCGVIVRVDSHGLTHRFAKAPKGP